MQMDRRLRQFLAVAETGNVSTAAEKLHVSQPTVSVNIRKLEQDHGVKLFKRSSRGVQLTEYGKVLYEHVKIMARLDEHAKTEIQSLKASRKRAMRIGTGFAWWSLFMRDIMNAHRAQNPDVSVHVDVCSSLDGLRNLLSGDISCFVGTKVERLSDTMGFDFERLFSVEDALFARAGHPLAGAQHGVAALNDYPRLDVAPFVNRHLGIIERTDFDPSLTRHVANERVLYSTNSVTTGINLLQDTDAILTYPDVFDNYFKQMDIARLDTFDFAKAPIDIGIYRLSEKKPDEGVRQMLAEIRGAANVYALHNIRDTRAH